MAALALKLLLTYIIVVLPTAEAFSIPTTKKLSTSYASIFSSLQYQQPSSTLILYGSLRDLVSSSDDDNDNNSKEVNSDDRNFGLSYSKYSDTKFRSRNVFGTGSNDDVYDEEAGLNADRLNTFSFASNSQQSGSQGILSGEEDVVEEDTVKDLDLVAADKEELDTEDIKQQPNKRSTELAADNFMNAVGINYSKRTSFPSREINEVSDEKDEKGLHGDRLSTFSFSTSQQPSSLGPRAVNKMQSTQQQAERTISNEDGSLSPSDQLGVDNFHGNINLNVRKDTAPANRSVPAEGLDNHYDRLSTYSKGQRPDGDIPSSEVRRVSKGSGGVNPSLSNDRLGTFSFGNIAPNGSTSSQGTSASNPLPNTPNESTKPPQYEKQEEPPIKSNQFDKIDQVFSQASSEKGSLSSLASSVSVKTRSERIKDIKKATDPRLLHPDGQDVPRLNSKGDVMSFSKVTQRPGIFERIELANEDLEIGDNEEEGDANTDEEMKDVYSVDESEYDGGNLILDKDDNTDEDDDSGK